MVDPRDVRLVRPSVSERVDEVRSRDEYETTWSTRLLSIRGCWTMPLVESSYLDRSSCCCGIAAPAATGTSATWWRH